MEDLAPLIIIHKCNVLISSYISLVSKPIVVFGTILELETRSFFTSGLFYLFPLHIKFVCLIFE